MLLNKKGQTEQAKIIQNEINILNDNIRNHCCKAYDIFEFKMRIGKLKKDLEKVLKNE